ncbi:hypothetical protein Lal_00024200 [Lupinus albus]|nr:hypothetical protein Lal_00024200 [Lupinus albus]
MEKGGRVAIAPLLSFEWLSLLFWLKKDGPHDDSRFVVGVGAGRGGSEAQVVMQVRGERSSPSGMLFVKPSEELVMARMEYQSDLKLFTRIGTSEERVTTSSGARHEVSLKHVHHVQRKRKGAKCTCVKQPSITLDRSRMDDLQLKVLRIDISYDIMEILCFAATVAGGNSLMVEHSLAKAEVEGSSPSFRSWLRRLVVTSRVGIASRSNPSFPGLPNTLLILKKPPANRNQNRNQIREEKKKI